MNRQPSNKTALLAAYLDAIDHARREGFTWRDLVELGGQQWGVSRPETLRVMYVNAKKAVAAGRYSPAQKPLPGDEAAEVKPAVEAKPKAREIVERRRQARQQAAAEPAPEDDDFVVPPFDPNPGVKKKLSPMDEILERARQNGNTNVIDARGK